MVLVLGSTLAWPVGADTLDQWFEQLTEPEASRWQIAEAEILREWSKSGSPAFDALLQRGKTALAEGDLEAAIGHLTALTDHAPEFATGWQARAEAFALAGYFGPAASDLARALSIEPRQYLALTQLGMMYEELGNDELATKAYTKSLSIHPHQQMAIEALARLKTRLRGTEI